MPYKYGKCAEADAVIWLPLLPLPLPANVAMTVTLLVAISTVTHIREAIAFLMFHQVLLVALLSSMTCNLRFISTQMFVVAVWLVVIAVFCSYCKRSFGMHIKQIPVFFSVGEALNAEVQNFNSLNLTYCQLILHPRRQRVKYFLMGEKNTFKSSLWYGLTDSTSIVKNLVLS